VDVNEQNVQVIHRASSFPANASKQAARRRITRLTAYRFAAF
jgi:hypothetical protein